MGLLVCWRSWGGRDGLKVGFRDSWYICKYRVHSLFGMAKGSIAWCLKRMGHDGMICMIPRLMLYKMRMRN
jgi:hypothetical protein